jgi:acetyl esterase/lipase
MDAIAVRREVAFGPTDRNLRLDLYYPPDETDSGRWPAVIIVAGYPGTMEPRVTHLAYKEIGWTVSMCQLIALSGIVALAYANHDDPVADLQALFEHIHEGAETLRIDPARVGVVAASGNVPTALTTIMQDARRTPACAVFDCGCFLDLDGATDVADAARQFRFANPVGGRTVADVRRDVPLFIMRAGRDQFPAANASADRFIRQGLVQNLPITFVNHAEGPHAFDLLDDSRTSRDIVRQILQFLRQHLTAED